MNVRIWQQFSSNHSASFTVVGVFESAEKAEEAANTIRDVVGRIHEFYHKRFPDFMDFYEWAEEIDIRSLSVFEIKLRQELKIRPNVWNAALDWVYHETPVQVYQNMIFVSSQGDTWSPFQPLDSLIKKAGGKFYGIQEGYGSCSFTLHCQASNEESAKKIEGELVLVETSGGFEYRYLQVPDGLKFEAQLVVKGEKISFTGLSLYASTHHEKYDTKSILSALVPYLEAQGCTDFQFKFKETRR
jgi:hypothetical protein